MKPVHPIQITSDIISATTAFKKLSKLAQIMVRKQKKAIQNGVNIVKNRGYEFWEKEFHASYQVKEIVKELTWKI